MSEHFSYLIKHFIEIRGNLKEEQREIITYFPTWSDIRRKMKVSLIDGLGFFP